jgi:hypothetical protein
VAALPNVVKGWYGIFYYAGTRFGYCDSVSFTINANLDPYYEVGSRAPVDLVVGQEEITGSIERAWIDNNVLFLVAGSSGAMTGGGGTFPAATGILPLFNLYFYADLAGTAQVYLANAKLENASIELTPDGISLTSSDFRARAAILIGG